MRHADCFDKDVSGCNAQNRWQSTRLLTKPPLSTDPPNPDHPAPAESGLLLAQADKSDLYLTASVTIIKMIPIEPLKVVFASLTASLLIEVLCYALVFRSVGYSAGLLCWWMLSPHA